MVPLSGGFDCDYLSVHHLLALCAFLKCFSYKLMKYITWGLLFMTAKYFNNGYLF